MASAATSSAEILRHIATFISETLAQPELRHRLVSTLRSKINPVQSNINLATSETIETAISTAAANSSTHSSALLLAERLLLSFPRNPLSSFLLSLVHHLRNQPIKASISLLNVFALDPSLARSEIAPDLFGELFLVHLLPVVRWYNEQRSNILPSVRSGKYDDESDDDEYSVVVPSSKLLSRMSGGQASELKDLERNYEVVLDENCKAFANYFIEVIKNDDESRLIGPPPVVLRKVVDNGAGDDQFPLKEGDETFKAEEPQFENGRYNPIWSEREKSPSVDKLPVKSKSSDPQNPISNNSTSYHNNAAADQELITSPGLRFDSEIESSLDDHTAFYFSSDSDSEETDQQDNIKMASSEPRQSQTQKPELLISADSSCSPDHLTMADADGNPGVGKQTPPKDFVCPITTRVFEDPVTLETGQTYERRAIQEWIGRGNSSCPITRQKLNSTQLPKTNYVLKRLIASWQEESPDAGEPEPEPMSKSIVPSSSPNSVISQATVDGTVTELRHAITSLCMSEILSESEMAVLQIERFWQEAGMELDIQVMLSKPPVISGFVEILFNSVDARVLEATIFLLSELGSRDKSVIQTLNRVESDVECVVTLFNKGLLEAVVLIYLLRPLTERLVEMNMIEALLTVIKMKEDEFPKMSLKPRSASVLLLGQMIVDSEESSIVSSISNTIVSSSVLESIIRSLEAESIEERIAAVKILLRCMLEDGKCRNAIADKAELVPVLESFMDASDEERFEIVCFLSELVKLNRRTFIEQILQIIKHDGAYSTMHTLLVYLQTVSPDRCPVVAGLLLQLDLLAEPRKMSIYREEAVETLISCLRNSDFPSAQVAAAETIVSLQGRFSASGKPLTRAILLKRAGLRKSSKNLARVEQVGSIPGEIQDTSEEEKVADDWERKMAFVLVSHEFGLLFEALEEILKSRYADLHSASLESAAWLVYMLSLLPDTGIRGAARVCLLKSFMSIFKSAKDIDDRVLALLSLNSFVQDPEGLRSLSIHKKDIMKGLREIRKYCPLAIEMVKVLSDGNDSSADFWNHKELVHVDSSENGEVLSIACFRDKIFSGHSDGTIKVWTGRGSILHLIQETREHTKAVTGLAILQSGEMLYSGSLDKTAKVWSIGNEEIHCVQVHDMKDQIQNLAVASSMLCFIPQGGGIKVHSWKGKTKLLNSNKYPKCMALVQGKVFCGCQDGSIQEVDLATGTSATIQTGHRKLLGKGNPVHALQVHNGLLYTASSGLDTAAVKIWSITNYNVIGSLPTLMEVRAMAVSSELVYLGCKGGAVEIWDQKKQSRVELLQTGTNGKILCMAVDENEEFLVVGTSDGRIQAWGLS